MSYSAEYRRDAVHDLDNIRFRYGEGDICVSAVSKVERNYEKYRRQNRREHAEIENSPEAMHFACAYKRHKTC